MTAAEIGLSVCSGIHIGEVVERDGALRGIAVHVAARVMAKGAGGDILVSQTTKDICGGTSLQFTASSEHALKGLEGTWRLFATGAAGRCCDLTDLASPPGAHRTAPIVSAHIPPVAWVREACRSIAWERRAALARRRWLARPTGRDFGAVFAPDGRDRRIRSCRRRQCFGRARRRRRETSARSGAMGLAAASRLVARRHQPRLRHRHEASGGSTSLPRRRCSSQPTTLRTASRAGSRPGPRTEPRSPTPASRRASAAPRSG